MISVASVRTVPAKAWAARSSSCRRPRKIGTNGAASPLPTRTPSATSGIWKAALYASSGLPDDRLLELARGMRDDERASVLAAAIGDRGNRRHKPGRAFERTGYRFDVLCDYGAFRDLQRHRPLTIEWQSLTTANGYELPPDIDDSGHALEFQRAPAMSRAGDRVELDRGAFVEAYELAPDSVEQLFVFPTLPGAGELVLRIPVASELDGFEGPDGLEFRNENGRVTYSSAIAIEDRLSSECRTFSA